MRTLRSFLALVTILGSASLADAADPVAAPGEAAIKQMIGHWSGRGTLQSEGKTHKISMTWDCAESAGAAGVRCRAVITGIPGFTYQFDDLWGYSRADNLVHWYTVTNAGEVHDHRGYLDDKGGLLSVDLPLEGKVLSEVITFKRSKRGLAMSWVSTHGGTLKERGSIELTSK